jgi:single-strand DNA-binding protein
MNNITIIGRIGADAEVRQVNTKQVISFSVAVDNGKDQPATWFRCSKWVSKDGNSNVANYIKKGEMIGVNGKVSLSEYNGKSSIEINVINLTLCGGKMPF